MSHSAYSHASGVFSRYARAAAQRGGRIALLALVGLVLSALAQALAMPPQAGAPSGTPDAAGQCRAKLERIQQGALTGSAQAISFTAEETNAYLQYEVANRYPAGVSAITVEYQAGGIASTARVDFDAVKRSARQPLPRMIDLLFVGTHDLRVAGRLAGLNGVGRFELESVELDGIPIPTMLVELLINNFLKPRFPSLDLDAPFTLPHDIDLMTLSPGRLEVAGAPAATL